MVLSVSGSRTTTYGKVQGREGAEQGADGEKERESGARSKSGAGTGCRIPHSREAAHDPSARTTAQNSAAGQ